MRRKILLACGIVASALYVVIDLSGTLRFEGYSATSQTVSELIAIDAPSRPLIVPLMLLYSVLWIAFGIGIWQAANVYRGLRFTGALLAAREVVGAFITVFAPIHLRGIEATPSDAIHGILTGVAGVFVLVAMAFAVRALGRPFLIYSIATMVVVPVCGALAFRYASRLEANLPTPWMGAWERISIYAYLLWAVVLAIALLRIQRKPQSTLPLARAA